MQKPLVNGSLSQTHILQIVIHVAAVVSFQLSHLLAAPMQPIVLVASLLDVLPALLLFGNVWRCCRSL